MRLLFATTHGMGHALPLLPFARAAQRAGHDVLLAGPPPIAALAEREGLDFHALAWPQDAVLAQARARVAERRGMERIEAAVSELFVGAYGEAALPGMLALVERFEPDAILHETAEASAAIAGDVYRVPTIRVGVALAAPYEEWWLAMSADALDAARARIGLRLDPGARRAARTPLFTQAPAVLDRHQGEPPETVHRFRDADAEAEASEAPSLGDDPRPLVPVSFGTMVPVDGHYPGLYRTVIDALAALPVRVLVTIGRQADPAALGPLPENVRVERWVPLADVLPHAAAFVTHGGAGTTLAALAAGVPMAFLPISADQPLNARLVARHGAGLALEHGVADAVGVGALVGELLGERRYGDVARGIADEIAALPPADAAVEAIEELAASPVPSG
jgi:UDP:flavonoid glycosyltransferase YjiC (YdhE family)